MWRFGVFELDETSGELRKQGRLVRLEPQPARALALLLARAGEVVTREDLRAHVWDPDTHVDFERGIAYCIGQVRAALGDSAENPRFVETLPRRGYRFVAPAQRLAAAPAPAATAAPSSPPDDGRQGADAPAPLPAASAPAIAAPVSGPSATGVSAAPKPLTGRSAGRRWLLVAALIALAIPAALWTARALTADGRPIVAVALFDNETGDAAYDPLAATAADVVVERLTGFGPDTLGVVGNTPALRQPRSARSPDAVAAETGAGYFVFGQIQPDDAGVRLVVHLIRLDDDTHLWVTRVARAPDELAGMQDVAADRLAEAVRRHVIERDPDAPRFTR